MDREKNTQLITRFEGWVYFILIILFLIVIVFSLIELGWLIVKAVITPPAEGASLLENHEILDIFGFFLFVLIGIELLGTMKAYMRDNVIHVEVVVILAIIAVARKIILLDPTTVNEAAFIGDGILILALCAGYYLVKKAGISI